MGKFFFLDWHEQQIVERATYNNRQPHETSVGSTCLLDICFVLAAYYCPPLPLPPPPPPAEEHSEESFVRRRAGMMEWPHRLSHWLNLQYILYTFKGHIEVARANIKNGSYDMKACHIHCVYACMCERVCVRALKCMCACTLFFIRQQP